MHLPLPVDAHNANRSLATLGSVLCLWVSNDEKLKKAFNFVQDTEEVSALYLWKPTTCFHSPEVEIDKLDIY